MDILPFALAALILSLALTVALMPGLIRLAASLGIVDRPGGRKVHDRPIPRIGGVAMVAGAVAAVAVFGAWSAPLWTFVAGAAVLMAFGLWDDRFDLSPRYKLLGQVAAVLPAVLWGEAVIRHIPLGAGLVLPDWAALPFTVFVLVGVTNAVNLSDGLDGLAGGMSLLCAITLVALAVPVGDPMVALAASATLGALLGFLRYNTHPARVFMGDAGSQFLGFAMGLLAVRLTQQIDGPLSPALPLLLLGLPVLDTLMVMGRRLWEGRSPFSADRNHLHHHLLALGLRQDQAVAVLYTVQAGLCVTAYLMRFESSVAIIVAYLGIASAGLLLLFAGSGLRGHAAALAGIGALGPSLRDETPRRSRVAAAMTMLWLLLSAYLLGPALLASSVRADVGLLAAVLLAAFSLITLYRRGRVLSLSERGVGYVVAVTAVYLLHAEVAQGGPAVLAGLLLLAATGLAVGLGSARRFGVTPLDLLVLLMALVVLGLSGRWGLPQTAGLWVLECLVLFYAVELLGTRARTADIVRLVVGGALAVLAIRGALPWWPA